MSILKDKKIIILVFLLVGFTIGYFAIVNKISYSFSDTYDATFAYNKTIEIIKECAKKYALDNKDLFADKKAIYIKVQDLIDNSYFYANSEGNVVNPLDVKKTLNLNIIKIKYENEKIMVEIDS